MRSLASLLILVAIGATLFIGRADGSDQDPVAAALLAKHRSYVGWQFGDGTFRTMRITGHVTDGSTERSDEFVLLSAGLVYRNTHAYPKRGGITEQIGFTGNLFWKANMNGFTTPVYGDYARYLASATVLLQEGTTELPATFVQDKTVDGKSVGVVRVTIENGDAIDCYVDPQTGAYVAATIDPGGAYEKTIDILSYRDVLPGKRMIASYRSDKSVISYDKFEPNLPVSNTELHPPAPTASWTFSSYEPVPITLTHIRVLVDATVNGVKGRFILDTGASAIVLDDQFADRAKVALRQGSGDIFTLYGPVKIRTRRADTIGFGGATLHNAFVFSEDFRSRDYRGLDRASYDGLIGYDLFAGAVVKLDLSNSKVTILDPADDLSKIGGLPLLVDLSEGIPAIPMTLNGSIPVSAFLDTGNPGVIFYGPDLRLKHHLRIWGCGNIQSLTIGPITYGGQMACEWGFAANDMLLGYDFLKHFDYVFDYPHGRMFMTPNKN
jgi:hypothetical protein